MKILFLDDDTLRCSAASRALCDSKIFVEIAKNLSEFKEKLSLNFDAISFDYDLGCVEFGTEAVDILIELNYNKQILCVVHSSYPEGAEQIYSKLINAGYNKVVVREFGRDWVKKIAYMVNNGKDSNSN